MLLSFNKFFEFLNYFKDHIFYEKNFVKIDKFSFIDDLPKILVHFRVGRKKLIQKKEIKEFTRNYYNEINTYDKQRLAKFEILGIIVNHIDFDTQSKEKITNFIKEQCKIEQLF